MKTAVVYYSLSGNVEYVAEKIAQNINADLIRIAPVKEYPVKGLRKFFHGGKSSIAREEPALKPYQFTADEYESIIFGTPVWASNIAPPLRTFIAENSEKLKGKNISAYLCFKGSGGEAALKKLNELVNVKDSIILSDPKNRKKESDDLKIRKFCSKI